MNHNNEIFAWIGMAHQYCINNPFLVLNFISGWIIISIFYVLFVNINDKIRKIKKEQGQDETNTTFKWFSLVFYSCASTRIISIITMFYGLYWLEAIFIWINAIIIVKCYYVYSSQMHLFSVKPITEKDIKYRVKNREKEIAINAKKFFDSLNIAEANKKRLEEIIYKKV